MKASLLESDHGFSLSLVAENMEDAAKLVRMGVNATKELKLLDTAAYKDGSIASYITVGKSKKPTSSVKKRW